jgi:hypothetical protein
MLQLGCIFQQEEHSFLIMLQLGCIFQQEDGT